MQPSLTLAILGCATGAISCSDAVCAGVGRPAVAVTVLDSVTGLHAANGATLILQCAACFDSAVGATDEQVLAGCVDYAGDYTVIVRKAGYRDWVRAGVHVRSTCSVETENLTARLESASP